MSIPPADDEFLSTPAAYADYMQATSAARKEIAPDCADVPVLLSLNRQVWREIEGVLKHFIIGRQDCE